VSEIEQMAALLLQSDFLKSLHGGKKSIFSSQSSGTFEPII
jgi:hypothetical protein